MIRFPDGEELLRETRGKTKKYGSGTLYITSKRVCFDSDRDGLCFDLEYGLLFNWDLKKKGIIIKWQELPEGRTTLTAEDPIHKVEIDLECVKHPKDKLSTPHIIHYTLFYAYTNSHDCVGRLGYGWHMNEKGELVHRFPVVRVPFLTQDSVELYDISRDVIEKEFVEVGTGDAKLDQMMFESNTMWNAWKKNGEYSNKNGYYPREYVQKRLATRIPELMEQYIETAKKRVTEWEEKIAELKKTGNTAELEKIMPSGWTGKRDHFGIISPKTSYPPEGNMYIRSEHSNKYLKAKLREKEIISGMKFDHNLQFHVYTSELTDILMAKLYANEDISAYTPEIEKMPDYTIEAKQKIEERRQKFNQGQT